MDERPLGTQEPLANGPDATNLVIPGRVLSCLVMLLEAYEYAQDLEIDRWAMAVELRDLRKLGLTNSDLRWLVGKRFVDHGRETTECGHERRGFIHPKSLRFAKRTCFALTADGVIEAQGIRQRIALLPVWDESLVRAHSYPALPHRHLPQPPKPPLTPIWDRDRQELRVGLNVVKQFKVPAANQECVLAAFQEESWPPRIDDPLSPQRDQDPKRRLHDTICSLNRNQKRSLIRFFGDGSGQGVRWEFAEEK